MTATTTLSATRPGSEGTTPARRDEANVRNRMLRLLPPAELDAVLELAEMVTIESKESVWERDQPIRYVHFPEDCVISLVTELDDGDKVEAMTVGNDGFAGPAIANGLSSSRLMACGQITGQSWRIAVDDFRKLMMLPGLDRLSTATVNSCSRRCRSQLRATGFT